MTTPPVQFDADGLIPAVIQDAGSGEVLMMAYMNAEALALTRETGLTHFWSRGRGRLWQKGETSGHVQHIELIAVNCYENCLLVRVRQVGACCHTGFQSCFYRELTTDGDLVTVRERAFDPEHVYGADEFAATVSTWYGAYRWLADHDLESVSGTSRWLRTGDIAQIASRVADELTELAGVIRGDHAHSTPAEDLALEASQVLYWLALASIRFGPADALTSEIVLAQRQADGTLPDPASALEAEATQWRGVMSGPITERIRETVRLLSTTVTGSGLNLDNLIARDLAELEDRIYLAPYFASLKPAETTDS